MKIDFKKYTYLLIFVSLLYGCDSTVQVMNERPVRHYSKKRSFVGAVGRIDIADKQDNKENVDNAYREAWWKLEDIDFLLDGNGPESDMYKINNAKEDVIQINSLTYAIIKQFVKNAKVTPNIFTNDLNAIVLLENNSIRFKKEALKIILKETVQGYAADQVAKIIRDNGLKHFQVELGDIVFVKGKNFQGQLWEVPIWNSHNRNEIVDIVTFSDAAVATVHSAGQSGTNLLSATVIAPSAQEAQVLANAILRLGEVEGTKMINHFNDHYASMILINKRNNQFVTLESDSYQKFKKE